MIKLPKFINYEKMLIGLFIWGIISTTIPAYAHPGRTDGKGGHYNRSTGEYHYHHGMSEHQHPGGVCPYSISKSPTSTSTTNTTQNNSSNIDYTSEGFRMNFFILVPVSIVAIYILRLKFRIHNLNDKNTLLDNELRTANQDLQTKKDYITELKKSNDELSISLKEKQQETAILEHKIKVLRDSPDISPILTYQEALLIAKVPNGVTFDEDGLPHYYSNFTVESNMHVYITGSGKKYHRIRGCSRAYTPMHLFTAAAHFSPCEKCIPRSAWDYKIPAWYYKYLQLMSQCLITDLPEKNTVHHEDTSHMSLNDTLEPQNCSSAFESCYNDLGDSNSHIPLQTEHNIPELLTPAPNQSKPKIVENESVVGSPSKNTLDIENSRNDFENISYESDGLLGNNVFVQVLIIALISFLGTFILYGISLICPT